MQRIVRLLAAVLSLSACLLAQSPTFGAGEAEALELKQHGDARAAGRAFLALLESATADPASAALAEYHALMALQLARQTGDWEDLRRTADAVRSGDVGRTRPWLSDRLGMLGLQASLILGDRDQIGQRTAALGCLSDWWLIGPFDNERGAGLPRAYGPEQGLDLTATYEGKKRPVQWRELGLVTVPAGRVDLDAILRPNDQVLCYAAINLASDRDREIALRLGSDEAFAVFLNGEEVLRRDVQRNFTWDQDTIPLRLRQGANLLLLKICDQEGAFEFAARITELDGSPATGVIGDGSREGLAEAARTQPRREPVPTVDEGAITEFTRAVERDGDPRNAFRLAYVLATLHPDDPTDRRDHRYALLAAAGMPDSDAARYLLAFTRIRPYKIAAEKDDNALRQDYEEILARRPDHVQALTALADLDLEGPGLAARAEELARRAIAANPNCSRAHLTLAAALERRGQSQLAAAAIEHAVGLDDPPFPFTLERWSDVLQRRGHFDAAIARLEGALQRNYDATVATELARLQMKRGRRDAALATIERIRELLPFERRAVTLAADLLEAEGDHAAAAEILRSWLVSCPEDDDAMVRLSRLAGLQGDGDRQREWLRIALELNPNRKNERRYLEFLEADETPFYSEFEIDGDAVLAADPGPPADAEAKNDTRYYLLDQRVVHAYRNGTESEYRHTIQRILNEEGARRTTEFYVQHYWGEQRARLLTARVIKRDGTVLQPRIRGYYVKFPPLEEGDAIEIRSRIDDVAPGFFGDYFGLQHRFVPDDGAPCHSSWLVVVLEKGREYRVQAKNGAPEATRTKHENGDIVLSYEMVSLPRRDIEIQAPSPLEYEPVVRISTYSDWNEFSAWWWNLIRKQTEVSPSMRAKVAELTAGLTGDDEKIAAIYDFVTTEIRYTAWEFGVHGYKPYSTPVIFDRRHGDCKDKSLLLNAMLSEVGIEAYPVLIHADTPRSEDDLDLPLVEHFNHCISYLPPTEDRPGMFLDGTATYHPIDTVPEMDQGADVLVVKGERGDVETIDWVEAEANADVTTYEIELNRAGDAKVKMVERPRRNQATAVRNLLGNEPAKRVEKVERRLSRAFGNAQVSNIDCSDLLDMSRPVEIGIEFTAPKFAPRRGAGLVVTAAIEGQNSSRLIQSETRDLPLLLSVPESQIKEARYHLPVGYAPVELPAPTEIGSPFGTYRLEWSFENGELIVSRRLVRHAHRVEPPEYPEYRRFMTAIDQADRQIVVVEPEAGR